MVQSTLAPEFLLDDTWRMLKNQPAARIRKAILWELFPVWVVVFGWVLVLVANAIPYPAQNASAWLVIPVVLLWLACLLGVLACLLAFFLCGLGWASLGYTWQAIACIVLRAPIVLWVLDEAGEQWGFSFGPPSHPLSPWFYPVLIVTLALPIASAASIFPLSRSKSSERLMGT